MDKSEKSKEHAKELLSTQFASNFIVVANKFLTIFIKKSLESNDILMNILAWVDKKMRKSRF
ncbi:hypothetical protein MHB56_18065 [Paenibacillus sp. FSL H8-0315]|uniref:hypothetical protein n=1 Tax=Paenibacillus sp. FSL H8-0315 TaxID=2921384 RepID=UPI0030F7F0D9